MNLNRILNVCCPSLAASSLPLILALSVLPADPAMATVSGKVFLFEAFGDHYEELIDSAPVSIFEEKESEVKILNKVYTKMTTSATVEADAWDINIDTAVNGFDLLDGLFEATASVQFAEQFSLVWPGPGPAPPYPATLVFQGHLDGVATVGDPQGFVLGELLFGGIYLDVDLWQIGIGALPFTWDLSTSVTVDPATGRGQFDYRVSLESWARTGIIAEGEITLDVGPILIPPAEGLGAGDASGAGQGMGVTPESVGWQLVFDSGVSSPNLISVDGDYNGDGVVDAADYTVWRNNLGDLDETDINGNGDGGGVEESDYTWWKQHFGNSNQGSDSAGQSTVPEPTMLTMLLAIALSIFVGRTQFAICAGSVSRS